MKLKSMPIAMLAITLASPFARAAETTLSFDDIVPGAGSTLTTQYANRGVTFEKGIVIDSPTARSAKKVAVGVRFGELGSPYIRAKFASPYPSSVTAWVENNVAEDIYLTAIDANGNPVNEVEKKRTAAPGTYFSLTVSSATPNIAAVILGGNPGGQNVVMDDLTFDRAQANGNAPGGIQIDAAKNRHPIDPRIYGITWATTAQVEDLNAPTNRHGGTPTTRYNWAANADNRGNDWFFESIGYGSAVPGAFADDFIGTSKTGGGEPMMTVPMIDWIAKLGPNRSTLSSYSVKKYGAQTDRDPNSPDFGNGTLKATNKPITNNDPNDANTPNSVDYQRQWLKHLIEKWGTSQNGGVRYYGLDNEPGLWHSSHRDVQPVGIKMDDFIKKALDFSAMIKEEDPNAIVTGPEEWGWSGYFYSDYDQQYGSEHNFQSFPDRAAHGNVEYSAWLLDQFHKYEVANGKRLLDIFTLHYYPQSGEFFTSGADAITTSMQLLRNESTRSLWDPNYKDKSWMDDYVKLIPRMKQWVNTYYPGTQIGLTEYNWGAENHINGATAQADVLGILGREGVDVANRWTTPETNTPTYNAMKLYRNYDGKKSTFGDMSVSVDNGPNPDQTAVFAAERTSDGAMTVMVVNKVLAGETPLTLNLANFAGGASAQVWQLTKTNVIERKADAPVNGGSLTITVPAQSITLFVVPKVGGPVDPGPVDPGPVDPGPAVDPVFTSSVATVNAEAAPGAAIEIKATVTDTAGSLDKAIVDVELYNAKGEKVAQKFWQDQDFKLNDAKEYVYSLNAPVEEGVYTVEIGVFTADWAQNSHWNDKAGTLTVKKPVAPAGDPAFTSSSIVTPNPVAPGQAMTITTTVTEIAGELKDAIVDVEVYNGKAEKVAQKFFTGQDFTPNLSEIYTFALNAPAEEGTYYVNVGVFTAEWTKNPHWNNDAATFTVKSGGNGAVVKGDLNGDGKVSLPDVIRILRLAIGIDPATPQQVAAGDLDGNGSVGITDAVALLRRVVGL